MKYLDIQDQPSNCKCFFNGILISLLLEHLSREVFVIFLSYNGPLVQNISLFLDSRRDQRDLVLQGQRQLGVPRFLGGGHDLDRLSPCSDGIGLIRAV